jgi:hypothetical protein
MSPNSDFLEKIGVRTENLIVVAGLRFERIEYLAAAREAINGREGIATLRDREGNVNFLPIDPPGKGVQFDHPTAETPLSWATGYPKPPGSPVPLCPASRR